MIRPSIPALFLLPALASPALASGGDLLVAGADGTVLAGDPAAGGFALELDVGPSLSALAQLGNRLVVATDGGLLYAYALETGDLEALVSVPSDATDIVTHEGTLLVSGSDGKILRVDPLDGDVLETLETGFEIAALAIEGDRLYAGTPFGVFHVKDLGTDDPFVFAGLCGGPINSIVSAGDELYLGDTTGNVYVYDKVSEFVTYAYTVTNDATSIVADGEHFLIGGSDGTVLRVLPPLGTVVDEFSVGSAVGDLLVETASSALLADTHEISLSSGGFAAMQVRAHEDVGAGAYLVLGSLTGTAPGIQLGSLSLPLTPDVYFFHTLHSTTGPLVDPFGALDALGTGALGLELPAGTNPGLVGATAHHAALVLDSLLPTTVLDTTNATGVLLVP